MYLCQKTSITTTEGRSSIVVFSFTTTLQGYLCTTCQELYGTDQSAERKQLSQVRWYRLVHRDGYVASSPWTTNHSRVRGVELRIFFTRIARPKVWDRYARQELAPFAVATNVDAQIERCSHSYNQDGRCDNTESLQDNLIRLLRFHVMITRVSR